MAFPFSSDLLVNKLGSVPETAEESRETMEWFMERVQSESSQFQDLLQKPILEVTKPGAIIHEKGSLWKVEN